ncbi:MAG TPA: YbaK/EbsC family protein, partial [Chlamydiales bacterium]|nr:YbaK/EbsC family protein [Chlamydiales bacterium]
AGNRIKARIFFGGENIRNEIIRQLHLHNIEFKHMVHDTTPTSQDSAHIRATKLEEGVKSLIVRGKNSKKNYQFNIPSHLKLDMKAVQEAVGEKCDFEDPAVIKERFGLIIGGVPPFGNLLNVDNYLDEQVKKEERAAFNCGLTTESIIMQSQDLCKITEPKIGKFSKN